MLNLIAFLWIDGIMAFLRVPGEVYGLMREYLWVIFFGIFATFLYNFFAALLRSIGNSTVPLIFLGASALLNIGLDLWFILGFDWGVAGAAGATVISQYLSGVGLMGYVLVRCPQLRPARRHWRLRRETVLEIAHFSVLTCFQQSVMNFGILMVQGLVNSFGPAVMAAFAAAVKIDSFAYMPVQEFGNAFSTFVAQNFGAKNGGRLRVGLKRAVQISIAFCLVITAGVFLLAEPLMRIFVPAGETEIVRIGARYLRIEGAFYCGIGCLFLFYGFFRGVRAPGISLLLTVVSLGTRVVLAYLLAAVPSIGVVGIWWSVPIGWLLADLCGVACYLFQRPRMERMLRPEAGGLPQQE